MKAAILIPYRGENLWRERNLQVVVDWYAPLGWKVTLGDYDMDNPRFNRAGSRNAAADGAGNWDVALFADADCLAELDVVRAAADMARETGKLILPHDDFIRLTEGEVRRFIPRMNYFRDNPKKMSRLGGVKVNKNLMPSGALVVTRESFDAIGRYDVGFKGWGYEDSDFLNAAKRTVGVQRLPGCMVHLHHPRATGTMVERAEDREYALRKIAVESK